MNVIAWTKKIDVCTSKHPLNGVSGCFLGARGNLVGESANHEANNGSGCDGGENGVSTVIIVDPVIAVWRVIEAPIIIVANYDRVGVIAVISANVIARHIVTIIHKPEGWPRVIVEWTVSTPVTGARRIAPEIVPTIGITIVIPVMVTAIIPVKVPVLTIVPIVVAIVAVLATVITAGIAIALIIAAIIGIATNLSVFTPVLETSFLTTLGPSVLALLEAAIGSALCASILALFESAIVAALRTTLLALLEPAVVTALSTDTWPISEDFAALRDSIITALHSFLTVALDAFDARFISRSLVSIRKRNGCHQTDAKGHDCGARTEF